MPIVGPGTPKGVIATEYEQTTGLERIEYLAKLQGKKIFLDQPLDLSYKGTPSRPIIVPSLYNERIVGCCGNPRWDHDMNWMWVKKDENARCIECGQVFKLELVGQDLFPPHEEHGESGRSHERRRHCVQLLDDCVCGRSLDYKYS